MSTTLKVPISEMWDCVQSYEEIKEKAIYAYYAKGDQYPVKIVMEEHKGDDGHERFGGYAIGHHRDGITIANQFSGPKHIEGENIDSITASQDGIDNMVADFLDECGWW